MTTTKIRLEIGVVENSGNFIENSTMSLMRGSHKCLWGTADELGGPSLHILSVQALAETMHALLSRDDCDTSIFNYNRISVLLLRSID